MYKFRRYLYALVAIAMITLTIPLQAKAELINIQFADQNSTAFSGAAKIGSSGDFWNQAEGTDGTVNPLYYSNSTPSSPKPSGAKVDFSGDTTTQVWDGSGFIGSHPPVGPYENLMTGFIATNPDFLGSYQMTFSGLKGSAKYDLYVYTQGNTIGNNLKVEITGGVNSSGQTTTPSDPTKSTFIKNQNYLVIPVTTTSAGGFILNYSAISLSDGSGEGIINGMQLSSAVPEPSTLILIGLGGLLLAFRLRRSPVAI